MSHHDAAHYAAKHAPNTAINQQIASEIQRVAPTGRLSCAQAHQIASALDAQPAEVGMTADLLEIRISGCQLGLFARRKTPAHAPPAAEDVPPALLAALESLAAAGTPLTCRDAWELAEQHHLTRAAIGRACDACGVKISACQVGTF